MGVQLRLLLFILIGNRLVDQTNQIIGGQVVKTAQGYKVFDFQFRTTCFDVVVSLLAFVQQSSNLGLGQIPILPDVSDAFSVIHCILLTFLMEESYHTHILSIDNYSKIE